MSSTSRVMTIGPHISAEQVGLGIVVRSVPFTDRSGWLVVPLGPELRTALREGELKVRLVIAPDADGERVLSIDAVRAKDAEFRSLEAFAMQHGGGWINYIPHRVKLAFHEHYERHAPRNATNGESERPRRNAIVVATARGRNR